MSSIPALRLLFSAPEHSELGRGPRLRRLDEAASHDTVEDPIVRALRAGDSATFEQLFRTQYPALLRFAHAIAGDDASDVVDDVFVWLWESRERTSCRGSIVPYLYSAVRHRALNVVRNQRKQLDLHVRFARDIAETTAARGASSDLSADETDLLTAVRAVIASLPERRRLAITLRWDSGLGNADIATVLGIAPQSVANLIQRALADIRAAFPNEFR